MDKIKLILRIIKFNFDPTVISKNLKLSTSKIWKKGDAYLVPQRIAPYNIWVYELNIKSIGQLTDETTNLLQILRRNIFFKDNIGSWESELGIVFELKNNITIGINLDTQILELLHELDMSFDVDIYCLHD